MNKINIKGIEVFGFIIDKQSRCKHYNDKKDIISLKCFSCFKYYPCFQCHNQKENHSFQKINIIKNEKCILCGNCGFEMTAKEYFNSNYQCLKCLNSFNENCYKHKEIYFE